MKNKFLVPLCLLGIYCSLAFINVEAKQIKAVDSVKITMSVDEYKSFRNAVNRVPAIVMESNKIPASFAVEVFNQQSTAVNEINAFLDAKTIKPKK